MKAITFEAEIKYILADAKAVKAKLEMHALGRNLTYQDHYYDHPVLDFTSRDHEFRYRIILEEGKSPRPVLTFKGDVVDKKTGSKSEYEVKLADSQQPVTAMLAAMGFEAIVEFTKSCRHYEFNLDGNPVAATVVRVPEIDKDYLEVEILVDDESKVKPALVQLEELGDSLGLGAGDQTTEGYSDMVLAARFKK